MIYRDERRTLKGVRNRSEDIKTTRQVLIFGENLNDVGQFLATEAKRWDYKSATNNPKSKSWDLDAGYEGALKLANEGWHDGALMVDTALQAIMPASGRQARWGWHQTGGSLSVSRFLAGHPKPMRSRHKRQSGSAPVLHLVVNAVASCMVQADQMANYGAALVGLIDQLENSGRRVHLDVCFVVSSNGARLSTGWNVKRASEPVDLSAVAFAIAHPANLRRIGLAMMERAPKDVQSAGYGMCLDIIGEDVPDANEATMLVDGVNHEYDRCNTPKDALRLAIEQLNKAAVLAGHASIDQPLIDEDEWLADLVD